MLSPILENVVSVDRPMTITAAKQTTAMSAMRRAYSTSEAPTSHRTRELVGRVNVGL